MKSLRKPLQFVSSRGPVRVFWFWVFFWLVFAGLRAVQLPGLGGNAALLAACFAATALLIFTVFLLRIEGGSLSGIGLSLAPKRWLQFALGAGLGIIVVAAMIGILFVLTPLEITASPDRKILNVLGASFVVLFALALMEELAFRSYPLFRLRQAWGIRPAIYISSIAFAFYHGLAFESLLGPGVWGLFYGWMAVSTNSIALPTGFHVGLNWLQALLGMKPRYSDSIWELSIGTASGYFETETVGIFMQLVLLVVGLLMVELLVRKAAAE